MSELRSRPERLQVLLPPVQERQGPERSGLRGSLPAELRCLWTLDLDALHVVCVYVDLGAMGRCRGGQGTALSQLLHVCERVCDSKPGFYGSMLECV